VSLDRRLRPPLAVDATPSSTHISVSILHGWALLRVCQSALRSSLFCFVHTCQRISKILRGSCTCIAFACETHDIPGNTHTERIRYIRPRLYLALALPWLMQRGICGTRITSRHHSHIDSGGSSPRVPQIDSRKKI